MRKQLFFLSFFLLSCRTRVTEAESKDAATVNLTQRESLVVIAGGFGSCPDDFVLGTLMRAGKTDQMYQLFFNKGLPNLILKKTGSLPSVFSVCFSGPDDLVADLTQSITGRYAWNLGKLDKAHSSMVKVFQIPQARALTSANFLTDMKRELQTYINNKKAAGIDIALYLIGHSYGGFTAIQLADYFSGNFAGLITIDPISMLKCQAHDMATKIYSTVTAQHPGCRTAPDDEFSLASIHNIQSEITKSNGKKWWYHTFQNAFPWLHSSRIPNGSGSNPENQVFTIDSFNSAVADGDYHSQMGRNEALWQSIVARFSQLPGI